MSLASLGQAFVATGAVAPATTSPVPMLPLANQRYRASGDERMVVRLGSEPQVRVELGAEIRAAIDDVYREAYPVAEETPEESVSEETQPEPETEEAQTEQEPVAVEEAQPAAEASEDAQPQLSGLAENGQPLFTTTSNRAYDRFRQKGFEADEKALAAGDDDAKAASAYIFDGDDARTAAFLGGDKRDLLAEAMRDDPERHAYLPPMFQGFDMQASDWKHQPLAPRGGGKNLSLIHI